MHVEVLESSKAEAKAVEETPRKKTPGSLEENKVNTMVLVVK